VGPEEGVPDPQIGSVDKVIDVRSSDNTANISPSLSLGKTSDDALMHIDTLIPEPIPFSLFP
jgi:hypothetical protein